MTRARYRAFKCRLGVHRPSLGQCRDCRFLLLSVLSPRWITLEVMRALEHPLGRGVIGFTGRPDNGDTERVAAWTEATVQHYVATFKAR